jgi:flagellar motor switch protein FliN/FliY
MADLDDPKAWGLSDEDVSDDSLDDPFEQAQQERKEAEPKPQPSPRLSPSMPTIDRDKLGLSLLYDVSLQVSVELGRTRMTVESLLRLSQGSVVELNRVAGEPLDIYVNNKLMARGEAVVVKEKFGVRITDVLSPEKRVEGLE